jgi:nucleoside-diphosphate-sugar epimerase
VAGASGLVGFAAAKHFARRPGWKVIAVSRRLPEGLAGVELASVDLTDRARSAEVFGRLREVTHVVYAALYEKPGLIRGWRERDQMETNLTMFANLLDPLVAEADGLRHVALLQGTKAYGGHVATVPIPSRERTPRHAHENFYFLQEDHLLAQHARAGGNWSYTILRPQVILGESLGSNMNLIPALAVYGAVLRETGEPLHFPGGAPSVIEVVSADLLARAIAWAGTSPHARNEIFNVTNGDVLVWRDAWPAVAEALGMEVGEDRPLALAEEMPRRAGVWSAVVDRYGLRAPRWLDEFVGQSFVYADLLLGYGRDRVPMPQLVSTIKIRQAGFTECLDSEADLAAWFARLRERRLIPPQQR